jgi:hypothetical protein
MSRPPLGTPLRSRLIAILVASLAPTWATGCLFGPDDGEADAGNPRPDARPVPDAGPRADARPQGACNDVTMLVAPPPALHIPEGETINYLTNPPSGGSHYPKWAKWNATYDPPMAPAYWVHNLEHGGVVLLYNCPSGCPGVVTGLQAIAAALPADPSCTAPVRTRTLISAAPTLPAGVQVAAAAWGATYTATCLDAPSLTAFVTAHYAMGPESLCAQGSVP